MVNDTDTATVIDKGDNETYEYIMWNNNDEEYDYAIHLKDSKTGYFNWKQCFKKNLLRNALVVCTFSISKIELLSMTKIAGYFCAGYFGIY